MVHITVVILSNTLGLLLGISTDMKHGSVTLVERYYWWSQLLLLGYLTTWRRFSSIASFYNSVGGSACAWGFVRRQNLAQFFKSLFLIILYSYSMPLHVDQFWYVGSIRCILLQIWNMLGAWWPTSKPLLFRSLGLRALVRAKYRETC